MTREEAEYFLRGISYKLGNIAVEYLSEKDGEKMREAIKALEQEPIKPMVEIDLYSVIKQKYIEREILDKIRAEIGELYSYVEFDEDLKTSFNMVRLEEVQRVLDKHKAESEGKE